MTGLSWRGYLLIMIVMGQTAQAAAPMSKKDLMARMRRQTSDADACFRMLYSDGTYGCASNGAVEAPVRTLHSSGTDVTEDSIVLIGAGDRDAFLTRLAGSAELQRHVKGVLVDATTGQPAAHAPNPSAVTLGNVCTAGLKQFTTAELCLGAGLHAVTEATQKVANLLC